MASIQIGTTVVEFKIQEGQFVGVRYEGERESQVVVITIGNKLCEVLHGAIPDDYYIIDLTSVKKLAAKQLLGVMWWSSQ